MIRSALEWLVLLSGRTSALPDSSANHDSAGRISCQFIFYHDHNFTKKSNGNLRFRPLVSLFVSIGVCVTTYNDGTVSDVTIGMWHHNHKPRTNSATVNLGFHFQNTLAMLFTSDDMPLSEWYNENMSKWCHESRKNYTFINLKATKISKRCGFVLVTWPWWLPEEWPKACGSLNVVGAGTMHGFGTEPIRNPTIWLVESRKQVN